MPASALSSRSPTLAASENSTQTRVTSVSSAQDLGARRAAVSGIVTAIRTPTATKTIGAVRSARSSRADSAPQPNTAAASDDEGQGRS